MTGEGEKPGSPWSRSSVTPGLIGRSFGRWAGTLEATLRSTAVPYGYTITIWVAGAYLVREQGGGEAGLGFGNAVEFVAGALLAFGVLASLSARLPQDVGIGDIPSGPDARHPRFAAGVHVGAIGLALGAAAASSAYLGALAWFTTPFLATGIYLAAAAYELGLALELSERDYRIAHGARVRRPAHEASEGRMDEVASREAPRDLAARDATSEVEGEAPAAGVVPDASNPRRSE